MFLFSLHDHLYHTIRYIVIVIRSIYDISLIVNGAKSGDFARGLHFAHSLQMFGLRDKKGANEDNSKGEVNQRTSARMVGIGVRHPGNAAPDAAREPSASWAFADPMLFSGQQSSNSVESAPRSLQPGR
jgi:hypothetical protein